MAMVFNSGIGTPFGDLRTFRIRFPSLDTDQRLCKALFFAGLLRFVGRRFALSESWSVTMHELLPTVRPPPRSSAWR